MSPIASKTPSGERETLQRAETNMSLWGSWSYDRVWVELKSQAKQVGGGVGGILRMDE